MAVRSKQSVGRDLKVEILAHVFQGSGGNETHPKGGHSFKQDSPKISTPSLRWHEKKGRIDKQIALHLGDHSRRLLMRWAGTAT